LGEHVREDVEQKGPAIMSSIVRTDACSPSNDPSWRVLHIDSAIVDYQRLWELQVTPNISQKSKQTQRKRQALKIET